VKLPLPQHKGILLKRYKRFLADIELPDGCVVTAHTPNTGSMQQCAVPGHAVVLSESDNPKRKLPYTLELIRVNQRWVDTNTQRANRVVEEGLRNNMVPGLTGYDVFPEYRFGESRLDFMLESAESRVLLEVKNVTLIDSCGRACFPDAVTTRGQKHLRELMAATAQGWRTVIFFLVQRGEAEAFAPADHIDAEYGKLLRQAIDAGVEAIAMRTSVSEQEVVVDCCIPVEV
jgi:sugar fermentation stimulation protein A